MTQEFCSIDWPHLFGVNLKDDVEKQWQFFKSSYTELVNIYVPIRSRSTDPCSNNVKTCKYNKEIAVSVRLWQRYMETRDGQKYAAYVKAPNLSLNDINVQHENILLQAPRQARKSSGHTSTVKLQ